MDKTIVRQNERSWAIELISQLNLLLSDLHIRIHKAGGESTLSLDKKSMFPDVLLYEDECRTKILQGWELKMPDVPITDETFIQDAARKANVLGLNSFVLWNFSYGKLYIRNQEGSFAEARVWSDTSYITTRADVDVYKEEWLPILKEILLTVNDYLVNGEITVSSLTETLSDNLITEIIQRNKYSVSERLSLETSRSMSMEIHMKEWWKSFHEEYEKDEKNMYTAYAKSILLNWTNRIVFTNLIRKYHNCANTVKDLDHSSTPEDGNRIIQDIFAQINFSNMFKKPPYNTLLPADTWDDLVDYNQLLYESKIDSIDQSALQNILERTVNASKREIRGQYTTPYILADLLCQITVEDWTRDCADFCTGTGTIPKAILTNKLKRLSSTTEAFSTTWASDKYDYPLQIASLALTSIENLNVSVNMFQKDIFALSPGEEIIRKNTSDHSDVAVKIPLFHAVVSNLPFIKYNNIDPDELEYMEQYTESVFSRTGIRFTAGKTDLYNFIPFKIHELLEENGKLGIITSNSWLGTDIGLKFFKALQFYYHINAIVLSDCGRWFENADVVSTLIVLQKKAISQPDLTEEISFCLTTKEIHSLTSSDLENLVHSIVLKHAVTDAPVRIQNYALKDIMELLTYGITINALFHDVSWIKEMGSCLIPIGKLLTVKRGERRGCNSLFYPEKNNHIEAEYRKPVLKKPASLQSYSACTDKEAFCCTRSKEELRQRGDTGALQWIEKFENLTNGTGKPLPEALKRPHHFWYEMDEDSKADFVTALNPDRRLFIAKFPQSTFVDQRFTRMQLKDSDVSPDLIHALLNSVYGMFAIEAIGFGRGLGVLDASSTRLKKMYVINPSAISREDAAEILELFSQIKDRNVMSVSAELKDPARERFDRKVLQALGLEDLYKPIKASLLSMQHTRHAVENQ